MDRREGSREAVPDLHRLADEIREIGFSCQRCGACCRPGAGDSGMVFASHEEVAALVESGAGSWEEVARPYPEFLTTANGAEVTFGWCVRHEGGRCRFLSGRGCTAYDARPWICRTYPFALVDGELAVSDCPGLGSPITPEDALSLARDLVGRARSEAADEERVKAACAAARIPEGKRCVIDSSGARILKD